MLKSRALIHQTLKLNSAGTRNVSKYFLITGATEEQRLKKSRQIINNSNELRYELFVKPDKVAVALDFAPYKVITDEDLAVQHIERKAAEKLLDPSFDGCNNNVTRGVIDLDADPAPSSSISFKR